MAGDCVVVQQFVFFSPRFFLLQAVAITVEDLVLRSSVSLRSKMGWTSKAVGFCWVLLWFSWSAPFWFDYMSKNGQYTEDVGVVSGKILELWKSW